MIVNSSIALEVDQQKNRIKGFLRVLAVQFEGTNWKLVWEIELEI